jgi:hypothetical protein
MSFSGAQAVQIAIVAAMVLFMVMLGYETIAQALVDIRGRKSR